MLALNLAAGKTTTYASVRSSAACMARPRPAVSQASSPHQDPSRLHLQVQYRAFVLLRLGSQDRLRSRP